MPTNILFMGRKLVAAESLKWLLSQRNVSVVGVVTDSHLNVSPTRDVAERYGIPILDREQAEKRLLESSLKVDLAFSVLYWQKIRKPVLDMASRGVINFHPAPLPRFKGTAGYNLAILEQLDSWAVTAHYVDENIDTGPIINVYEFPIERDQDTAQSVEQKSQKAIFHQFKHVASMALNEPLRLSTSNNIGGRYVGRAEMEAMKEIKPGDNVSRKIRAFWFPPYTGAYVVIDGVKYTLVDSRILESLADPKGSSLFTPSAAT